MPLEMLDVLTETELPMKASNSAAIDTLRVRSDRWRSSVR